MRLTSEQLKKIQSKYGVDRLWSFSRQNNFKTCPMCYFLTYIKHEKATEDGIYGILGGEFHEILEKLYTNEIKYNDMENLCDEVILNTELEELQFNKADKESNEKIANKYHTCIRHFFKYHKQIPYKVNVEKFITVKVGEEIFQGYIDAIHKENDTYVITDWKTSTIYTGKKIDKENKQLLLYALGLHQKGIPIDKIKIRWNFLKYNAITYTQKNGKEKTVKSERWEWVGKIKVPLKRNLKDLGYEDEDIERLLTQCIDMNSIEILPKEVQDLYKIDDCYVYIDFNEDTIKELTNDLTKCTKAIREKEQLTKIMVNEYIEKGEKKEDIYNNPKIQGIWNKNVEDKDSYFCSNLCGFNVKQCSCWKKYLEEKDLFKNKEYKDERLNDNNSKDSNEVDNDDMSWLDDI